MEDFYKKVKKTGIFKCYLTDVKEQTSRGKYYYKKELNILISADKFPDFINAFNNYNGNIAYPINATIYDDEICNMEEYFIKEKFLLLLSFLPIKKADFYLSDDEFPIYGNLMSKIKWPYREETNAFLSIDRHPTSYEAKKNMNIEDMPGKIHFDEDLLMWFPTKTISSLGNRVDKKAKENALGLKNVVSSYATFLDSKYDVSKLDTFSLTELAYDFTKQNVRFPVRYVIETEDKQQLLSPLAPSYISSAYGSLKYREGICSGQSKLIKSLLNNKYFNVDATTIVGYCPSGRHEWVGVVYDDMLLHVCPTINGPFKPLPKMGYRVDAGNYYISLYKQAYLSDEDIQKVRKNINRLTKK